jgi:hypothetical protein
MFNFSGILEKLNIQQRPRYYPPDQSRNGQRSFRLFSSSEAGLGMK